MKVVLDSSLTIKLPNGENELLECVNCEFHGGCIHQELLGIKKGAICEEFAPRIDFYMLYEQKVSEMVKTYLQEQKYKKEGLINGEN